MGIDRPRATIPIGQSPGCTRVTWRVRETSRITSIIPDSVTPVPVVGILGLGELCTLWLTVEGRRAARALRRIFFCSTRRPLQRPKSPKSSESWFRATGSG